MATTGTKTYQNYIGGEWVDAASGETFESHNPATGDLIGVFPKSSTDDVDYAAAAAKDAYERWRLVPAPKRAEILFRVGQRFLDRKDELTELMVQEMGKVRAEAGGDVQEAIDMTYYMAGEGRRLFGQTTPSEMPDKFQMSIRMPIGVVGALTPWNFPIAIPSWKNAASLLKHVRRELAGKNAIIVMDDADLELAVDGILWSAFGTSGQRCSPASRVIVHRSVYDELQTSLVAAAERLRLGPGWEDE